jgi:hypothetical protein
MKKKLLITCKDQFGYHIDTYKYCKYLSDEYDITYLCLDWGKQRVFSKDINIIYIDSKRGVFGKFLYFVKKVISEIRSQQYDAIFLVYFRFCFLATFFSKGSKMILDIRTGSVSQFNIKRRISNIELKLSSLFFRHITVISPGVAQTLGISKYNILPLGSDKLIEVKQNSLDIESVNLIYVGTLTNRRIEETIEGYSLFINNCQMESKYTIIGDGEQRDKEKILNAIDKFELKEKVNLIGRVQHEDLGRYLADHNVGVSFVPITDYYNFQPPTKTYEYLMNGLICIATATFENKKIINKVNGVLCDDSATSFGDALLVVSNNLGNYKANLIVDSVIEYSWEEITKTKLKPILVRR